MAEQMVRYEICTNCKTNGYLDPTEQFGKYINEGKKFWECQRCHTYVPDISTREPIEYRGAIIDGREVVN